ncbi:Glutamate decarboxylase [Thalictrum thalictroides]|uniref:Glutamate decarboxylase n=1 Tax=Thalictrum thalictroides TaxID=46969 RepID=A0A7J6X9Y5_THATH|nr:Glutamate decarboxylase [Thalictrum thalictroides]
MDPVKAVQMVDENTICVAAILGSTLNGEFEDVKLLNDLLLQKNTETGLPLVKSINVSGHNSQVYMVLCMLELVGLFGEAKKIYLKSSSFISTTLELINQPSHSISPKGYKKVMQNCMESARLLLEGLEKMDHFEIVSKVEGVPLVAFAFKNQNKSLAFKLSKALRHYGWIVPAYTMPANAQHVTILRVVIREDLGRQLVDKLLSHVECALGEIVQTPTMAPKITFTIKVKPTRGNVGFGNNDGTFHVPGARET